MLNERAILFFCIIPIQFNHQDFLGRYRMANKVNQFSKIRDRQSLKLPLPSGLWSH